MLTRVKNYIKSLGFDWTDITIIPFFTFTIIFVLEDVRLMAVTNDLSLSQPLWAYILYSIISIVSLALFLIIEFKKGRKPSVLSFGFVIVFLLFSILAIYLNPNTISMQILDFRYDPYIITTYINNQIKFIYSCSFVFFIISLYLWLTIFPKKYRNFSFVTLLCCIFYAISLFVFIFSAIFDDYFTFFSILTGDSEQLFHLKDYTPTSIFGNSNGFALFLELGLFLSLLHHSIKRWKVDYVIAFLYLIFIPLTICKTAVIGSFIGVSLFIIATLIYSIINKDKSRVLAFAFATLIIVSIVVFFVAVYYTNEDIKTKIDILVFYRGKSLRGRDLIWKIGNQIAYSKVFFGNGHGIYNHILFDATTTLIERSYFTSHNSFLTLAGEGGVLYLLSYLALIGYSLFLLFKMVKKHFDIVVSLLLGLLVFLFHSIFEDIYYYVELIIVFIIICYNVTTHQDTSKKEKN